MMPHGICLFWNPPLIIAHVAADGCIALAYFTIPYFLFIAKDWISGFLGRSVLFMFSAFIVACGMTHVMDIVVLWQPWYWLQACVKNATAILSVATACHVLPLARILQSERP